MHSDAKLQFYLKSAHFSLLSFQKLCFEFFPNNLAIRQYLSKSFIYICIPEGRYTRGVCEYSGRDFVRVCACVFVRVSDPDPDPQDPHVFALPGSGSGSA